MLSSARNRCFVEGWKSCKLKIGIFENLNKIGLKLYTVCKSSVHLNRRITGLLYTAIFEKQQDDKKL